MTGYCLVFGMMVEGILMLYVLHRHSRDLASTRSRIGALGFQDALTGLHARQHGLGLADALLLLGQLMLKERKPGDVRMRLDATTLALVSRAAHSAQALREQTSRIKVRSLMQTPLLASPVQPALHAVVTLAPAGAGSASEAIERMGDLLNNETAEGNARPIRWMDWARRAPAVPTEWRPA